MATAANMRKLALALPETEERSHFSQPDFRVRGKIFAGLSVDEKRGTLKLSAEIQTALVDGSGVFTPAAGAWGRSGWTYVELARVEAGMLGELLQESWALVAPKSLAATATTVTTSKEKVPATTKKLAATKQPATKRTRQPATSKKTTSKKTKQPAAKKRATRRG